MANSRQTLSETYHFTLLYTGVDDLTDEWVDALYESGCDDAIVGMQNGFVYLGFSREASTLRQALRSAIEDVDRTGLPIQFVRGGADLKSGDNESQEDEGR